MKIPAEISDYIEQVKSEKYPTCEEQKKLIKLVEKGFNADDVYVDIDRLQKFMSYQKYFSFNLFPWEKFVFSLHNCTFYNDGSPRWPDLFVLSGRGAGKNGFLSFEGFCQLTEPNGVPFYNVDICATSEDQAKTSFDEIWNALENPKYYTKFRKHFRWNRTQIENLDTHSVLRYRTNNAKGKDGLRSGSVFFDEVHAYENWENINVFTTGLGKKPCPRRTYVTTNGDVRDGVLDKLIAQAENVLDGRKSDDGFLPFICKLDKAEEVDDESFWYKANPSLQYFPNLLKEIRREYQEYKLDPQVNTAFMTKRMNLPQTRTDIAVTSWENILSTNREMPNLSGWPCVCGIDYAKTNDMIGAVLLFFMDDIYYVIHHSWFCSRSNDKAVIKIPLDEMERRGILTIVDEAEISPNTIAEWITEQRKTYNIKKIAIDNYRYTLLANSLKAAGYYWKDETLKLVRPSDVIKAQPVINSIFATHRIVWADDPLMRWYTNNAKLVPAPNNNWTFGKIEPRSRKTDGFMAFVSAMTLEEELHVKQHRILEPFVFD